MLWSFTIKYRIILWEFLAYLERATTNIHSWSVVEIVPVFAVVPTTHFSSITPKRGIERHHGPLPLANTFSIYCPLLHTEIQLSFQKQKPLIMVCINSNSFLLLATFVLISSSFSPRCHGENTQFPHRHAMHSEGIFLSFLFSIVWSSIFFLGFLCQPFGWRETEESTRIWTRGRCFLSSNIVCFWEMFTFCVSA